MEPAAVPGRKHSLYALDQAARLGGRKRPVKRGVGMGVQIVADPDQALGLAVAVRHGPSGSTNIQRVQVTRRTYS